MSRRDSVIGMVFGLLLIGNAAAQEIPPPVPPGVDDRDYLLRKQQEIFRLSVETDYALALQKLCQTGYGDPGLCHTNAPLPSVNPAKNEHEAHPIPLSPRLDLPIVQEISGLGSALKVILKYADGRMVTAEPGTILPGGDRLMTIDARQVVIKRSSGAVRRLSLPAAPSDDPAAIPSGSQR